MGEKEKNLTEEVFDTFLKYVTVHEKTNWKLFKLQVPDGVVLTNEEITEIITQMGICMRCDEEELRQRFPILHKYFKEESNTWE